MLPPAFISTHYYISASARCQVKKELRRAARISGNAEFSKAGQSIRRELDGFSAQLPEVQAFLEDFLPSFSLTLDELN